MAGGGSTPGLKAFSAQKEGNSAEKTRNHRSGTPRGGPNPKVIPA